MWGPGPPECRGPVGTLCPARLICTVDLGKQSANSVSTEKSQISKRGLLLSSLVAVSTRDKKPLSLHSPLTTCHKNAFLSMV